MKSTHRTNLQARRELVEEVDEPVCMLSRFLVVRVGDEGVSGSCLGDERTVQEDDGDVVPLMRRNTRIRQGRENERVPACTCRRAAKHKQHIALVSSSRFFQTQEKGQG